MRIKFVYLILMTKTITKYFILPWQFPAFFCLPFSADDG